MIKKALLGLGVFTVVLISGAWGIKYLIFDAGLDEQEKLNNALVLGDVVIDMYREEITSESVLEPFKNDGIYSKDVEKSILEYQETLKSLDSEVFDLSEYYYNNFEVYEDVKTDIDEYLEENPEGNLFEVAEDENSGSVEETITSEDEVLEDSSIIYYEGERALINVKDFTFSEGVATITFKGRTFAILQVNVPQTYTAIKSSTKYLYSYTDYLFDKDAGEFVDLQYTSVKDPKEVKIIRVYFDKKDTITGFVVR